jgi:hypothetical protein
LRQKSPCWKMEGPSMAWRLVKLCLRICHGTTLASFWKVVMKTNKVTHIKNMHTIFDFICFVCALGLNSYSYMWVHTSCNKTEERSNSKYIPWE